MTPELEERREYFRAVPALPYLNSAEVPYFDGQNVSQFLQDVEELFQDYIVLRREQTQKIIRYYKKRTAKFVEKTEEQKSGDQVTLREYLIEEYLGQDKLHKTDNRERLEELRDIYRDNNDLVAIYNYYREFLTIFTDLLAADELDKSTQARQFVERLPRGLQSKVIERTKVKRGYTPIQGFTALRMIVQDFLTCQEAKNSYNRPIK